MSKYHARIQTLTYDKAQKTFYTTQEELKKIGILYGIKFTDTLLVHGIKESVEFQYSCSHGAIMTFIPINPDFTGYLLIIDI